jgi:membrane-associated phospholipid phosphatase
MKSLLFYRYLAILICIFFNPVTLQLQAQGTSETTPKKSTVQTMGDVIIIAMPAATLGTSLIIGDNEGAWQFTKGILLNEVVTRAIKFSVNKPRPDNSNDNAFPSGHTSVAFHSAGYIHRRYGFKYSLPAYALAGFTGASRIDSKKHDILDVIAGAAIGLGTNLILTTEYQQEHMEITFNSQDGDYLLGFSYKF